MMKKLFLGLFTALTATLVLSLTAMAAPAALNAPLDKEEIGPFEGTFSGIVMGDKGSQTTLTVDLTDRDYEVTGNISLGGGLIVDAGGFCGNAVLPASAIWAEGETTASHPDELSAEATIDVGRFDVIVTVDAELSEDGETMDVEAEIDTPWMCGRDPVIQGTLTKSS